MQTQATLSFPNLSLEKQIEEALIYEDPIKVETLLALGTKVKDIERIGQGIFKKTSDRKRVGEQNLKDAKGWQNRTKGSDETLLQEVFCMKNPERAEEALRFYIAIGGDLAKISKTAASLKLPNALGDKAQFLDILRRTIKLEKIYLQEKKDAEPPKKSIFSTWFKDSGYQDSTTITDEIEKISTIFRFAIKDIGEEKMMHQACASGFKDLAVQLIELGVAVNCKFPGTDATPLHTAAFYGKVDLMVWLLDLGAEIDAVTKTCEETVDKKKSIKGHETALHMATLERRMEAVALLLQRGASIEILSAEDHTALHYACYKDPEIAKLLLSKGAKFNATSNKGVTPLHYAAMSGFYDLFMLLLAKGADLSAKDSYNETPLEAVLDNGPYDIIMKLFSGNKIADKMMSGHTLREFIEHCKENPHELIVESSEFETSNPLEIPFLLNLPELAGFLKILMSKEQYEQGIKCLQIKYPKQTLKILIDAGTTVQTSFVPKLKANQTIPQVPDLHLETLFKRFKKVQFFTSSKLTLIPQEKVYINPEGSIMRRSVNTIYNNKKPQTQIIYDKELPFEKLDEINYSDFKLNESGKISVGQKVLPYVILKIDDVYMPVKIFKKEGIDIIELRVELYNALLSEVNFTNKDLPGYRNPKTIVDSGSAKDSDAVIVKPEAIKQGLKAYCDAINFRIPYTGTPSEEHPKELELWYQYLDSIAKHNLLTCLNEDIEALGSIVNDKSNVDPTPSAPSVIELGISGLHCGTRALDDSQFIYDAKRQEPKTFKDRMLAIVDNYKTGIASKMVDLDHDQNVHIKNKILQVIDEECGISEDEKMGKYYFLDPISPKVIDRKKIMEIFIRRFTATQIIDLIDKAINGSPSEIDKDLVIDWFKDNAPSSFQADKYAMILKELPDGDKYVKAKYLEKFDMFFNPVDLKKEQEPDWEKVIEDDRRYIFIQDFAQNQLTGKIEREAIIFMLASFGLLLKAS